MQPNARFIRRVLFCAAAFSFLLLPKAPAKIMDNGVDPANLGKGDHIYVLATTLKGLGGNVPAVTNIASLMAFEKSQGMDFLVVKSGTGGREFPSASNPQFTEELVEAAHAAGLKIFAYTRSDGKDVRAEIHLVAKAFRLGADGFVLDAEAEWETRKLENNFEKAVELCSTIKKRFPNKFLAHAPMPVIHLHQTFPYKEFSYYCDAIMPQYYWQEGGVGKLAEYSPKVMVAKMDVEWREWQNSLRGPWTNCIKPIAPIGQAWNTTPTNIVTADQITDFVKALRENPHPVTATGYNGVSYWRADLHTPEIWKGIAAGDIGKAPSILQQPQSVIATNLPRKVVFTVEANGAMPRDYQWFLNGKSIAGATDSSYKIPKAKRADAGSYTVVVINRLGSAVSEDAVLKVNLPTQVSANPLTQER
jgi:hypothetical protein